MATSNLIALGALIVATVGLIPQFYQIFSKRKSGKNEYEKEKTSKSSLPLEKNKIGDKKELKESDESKEPMPFMLRILLLVIFAVASFLIEIIVFGIIAHYCGVEVNLDTMSLFWKVIFYSIFFIPGTFLFLAILILVANTTD